MAKKLNKISTIAGIAASVLVSGTAVVYGIERFLAVESAVEELTSESTAGKLQRAREQVGHYEQLIKRRNLSLREMKDYRYWSRRVIELEQKMKKRS